MTAPNRTQPMNAHATPVCCYCDADLSCARCGREQPYDDISILKARIQDLEDLLCRWVNLGANGAYGLGTKFALKDHPIITDTLAALQPKDSAK